MLLVHVVVTFIFSAILPNIAAVAVHDTILEGTREVATVSPFEASFSAHLIVLPEACILGAISPEVNAFTFLDSIPEISMIVATIRPDFNSSAVLNVFCSVFRG